MKKEILVKYLKNNCTDDELNEVIRWVDSLALNDASKSWGFEDWESIQVGEKLDNQEKLNSLLDKIHHKINIDTCNPSKKISKVLTASLFSVWLTRAAAFLLIPVLTFLLYTLSEKYSGSANYSGFTVDSLEIVAPIGSRTTVHLSDGSEVHLNYGSKLKYPLFFSGDTREVQLSGEGFFDVAHNPKKPFIVKTRALNIKAMGTSFNVFAYPDEDKIETTLVNGKVALEQTNYNGRIRSIGTMVPGQHIKYSIKTGEISSSKGSVEEFIAWKEGKLIFENQSIIEVTNTLSRMFNVDIDVADNIKDYSYTVKFVDEPLLQILDLMTIATPVSYKIIPRKKIPDGEFSKQRIIIEKRP